MDKQAADRIAGFFFEAGIFQRMQRTGLMFLGSGEQSVAEHVFRTCIIGFTLAGVHPEADSSRVLAMCLLHDIEEGRTGDLNYFQQRYVTSDDSRALAEVLRGFPSRKRLTTLWRNMPRRRRLSRTSLKTQTALS